MIVVVGTVVPGEDAALVVISWPIAVVVAVLVAGALLALLAKLGILKSLSLRAGPVAIDMETFQRLEEKIVHGFEAHGEKLDAIDHAVNNTGPNEPTIRETVESHSGEIAAIRRDVGKIGKTLTDGLAAVNERLDEMAALAAKHHPEDT